VSENAFGKFVKKHNRVVAYVGTSIVLLTFIAKEGPRRPRCLGRCQKVGMKRELKEPSLESHGPASSFPNVSVLTFLLCMLSYNSIAI